MNLRSLLLRAYAAVLAACSLPLALRAAVHLEKSVASRSAAVDFPDFTRGKWKTAAPLRLMRV